MRADVRSVAAEVGREGARGLRVGMRADVRSVAAEVGREGERGARIEATIADMVLSMRGRSVRGRSPRAWAAGSGVVLGLWAATASAAPTQPGQLTNAMQPASECNKCHAFANGPELAGEPLVTPVAWQATMMGSAARDPVFWAGVAIAHQDEPGATAECVRCHAPRAYVGGREAAIGIDELLPDDLSGVDCELCHRLIEEVDAPAGDARYVIDDVLGLDGDVPKRGPWDYQVGEKPKHGFALDAYVGTSRMCGTCHDVTTSQTRVDAGGNSLGVPFGEQRTYSEWLGSAFAAEGPGFKSCQDCHMPAVADVAGCAELEGQGDRHATGGRRHDLAGANRRMVELLKQMYGDAGEGAIGDVFFDIALASIDRTLAESATLEVSGPSEVDLGVGLAALAVKVTNNTGHKLPTGYSEGRVMWLEVTGRYGDEVVYSSGRWLEGQGLEADGQLRSYEAVAVEHASQVAFHLLRNDTWLVDSRIPPKGLKKNLETDPVGDRYALLPDETWPNYDEVSYGFPAALVVDATPDDAEDDVMTLSVRLLYVLNTPEYVQFLADENNTNEAGQAVADLFAGLGPVVPLELAAWSETVPLRGLMLPAPGSSSGEGTSTSAAPTTGEVGGTSSGSGSGGAVSSSGGEATAASEGAGSGQNGGGDGGCGCRAGGEIGGLGGLGGLVLLGLRRRRRR